VKLFKTYLAIPYFSHPPVGAIRFKYLSLRQIIMVKNELSDKIEELDWDFDGKKITKELDFESFAESLDFLNEIASLVEDNGSHPKAHITADGVKLTLPATGQLKKDHVDLAGEIDNL